MQPANKNPRGRYLERIGYWLPRKTATVQRAMILNKHRVQYWLGVGATSTNRVHRILEKFNFVPKTPIPFGHHTLYEKPEKDYGLEFYKKAGPKGNNKELYLRQQLQEHMTVLKRREKLQQEALANLGINPEAAIPGLEEVKTEEIESEEVDIFERKNKFDELLRRIERHRKDNAHLRGNDLRYNIYMRKLNKLTRKDLGLDLEAYKDFVNNLKQFAHVNKDFEIFARDSLTTNEPEQRELIEIRFKTQREGGGLANAQDITRFNVRCEEINNMLRKLRREARGFLTARDKELAEDLIKNLRDYLRHIDLYEMVKGVYDKRQLEIRERRITNNGIIDVEKVKEAHLEEAGVSKREFDAIKVLLAVDSEIFRPSEFGSFSPHSMIVDVGKYAGKKLPKEVKEILYRPPKVKSLYDKYWQLAKICENIEKVEHDREILLDYKPRYPTKPLEETQLLDRLMAKLEELIEEDKNAIARQQFMQQAASSQLAEELAEEGQSIYYPGAGQEALDAYRKLSPEERNALKRGDEVDEVNTTDLEVVEDPEDPDSKDMEPMTSDFLEYNRINMARAFLGMDGGYSVRKLKKFLLNERKMEQQLQAAKAEEKKAEPRGEEGADESAAADIDVSGPNEEVAYSDESDLDEALNNMDDETFEKLVEEANAREFNTEEEAKAFFEAKLADWARPKLRKRKVEVDHREKTDPYYAMMKEERQINSRMQNYFELDDEDVHGYLDSVEKNIGRYPIGFRHYENFENFKAARPEATIQEYQETSKLPNLSLLLLVNRQVEYDEFKEIMKTGFLQECKNPYFMWKNRFMENDFADTNENLTPDSFVGSVVSLSLLA